MDPQQQLENPPALNQFQDLQLPQDQQPINPNQNNIQPFQAELPQHLQIQFLGFQDQQDDSIQSSDSDRIVDPLQISGIQPHNLYSQQHLHKFICSHYQIPDPHNLQQLLNQFLFNFEQQLPEEQNPKYPHQSALQFCTHSIQLECNQFHSLCWMKQLSFSEKNPKCPCGLSLTDSDKQNIQNLSKNPMEKLEELVKAKEQQSSLPVCQEGCKMISQFQCGCQDPPRYICQSHISNHIKSQGKHDPFPLTFKLDDKEIEKIQEMTDFVDLIVNQRIQKVKENKKQGCQVLRQIANQTIQELKEKSNEIIQILENLVSSKLIPVNTSIRILKDLSQNLQKGTFYELQKAIEEALQVNEDQFIFQSIKFNNQE